MVKDSINLDELFEKFEEGCTFIVGVRRSHMISNFDYNNCRTVENNETGKIISIYVDEHPSGLLNLKRQSKSGYGFKVDFGDIICDYYGARKEDPGYREDPFFAPFIEDFFYLEKVLIPEDPNQLLLFDYE